MTLSDLFAELAKEGLTHKELGALLGVSQQTATKYVNNQITPHRKHVKEVADILGISQAEAAALSVAAARYTPEQLRTVRQRVEMLKRRAQKIESQRAPKPKDD